MAALGGAPWVIAIHVVLAADAGATIVANGFPCRHQIEDGSGPGARFSQP